MSLQIPARLAWLESVEHGREWLFELPSRVSRCTEKWELRLQPPYSQSFVSIVFPVTLRDRFPAVLKIQWPHAESEYEHEALRLWKGRGAVQLYEFDPQEHALLIERCEPGDHLSSIDSDQALDVLVEMLPRLWMPAGKPFRSLAEECAEWRKQLPSCWELAQRPFERALLDVALEAMDRLSSAQGDQVLLHQDLHGDNVLRAMREPWLVIDPKPLVGEREFSLAPVIRSYEFGHSRSAVVHRLDKLTSSLGLDRERCRLWALVQTLAWCFDDTKVSRRHVETARWLWQA
ncbi:streptomycin 6-kinase/streptomycin 6-kinase [Edaphobacter aggregans]|uniref:Streptomycin 6-kinase/streptomycin 6-kinase n=1 Tax=Edaphobacter aggregans TaxID=570835 RepID=A0A3R9Q7J3_9BACT|nr:aminoglycoside phosphotransferase family protein [Edaphobacter aggregans]RSL14556.1 streptomycin 6-kinase/streptomycin 6-kinase [Edaphobacter aggregans]